MWTKENRGRYDRIQQRYPSDLTAEEWRLVELLIPPAKRGGGKRRVDMREVVNGMVPVQSFGSGSIKALRTRTGSGSENCIPDCGRPVVFVPKFAEVELTS